MSEPATPSPEPRGLLDRLIASTALSVEKLPVLKQIFTRSAKGLADAYRSFGCKELDVSVDYIGSGRPNDLLGVHQGCITATVRAEKWSVSLLIGIDRAFLLTMVDVLFGADGAEPRVLDDRPATAIEREIQRLVLTRAAAALSASFSPVAETAMVVEKIEPLTDPAAPGGKAAPIVVAKFNLTALGGVGRMFVAVPRSAIIPFREKLEKAPAADEPSVDPVWAERFKSQIRRAGVEVTAILGSRVLTLGDIAALKPGQVIELDRSTKGRVRVECKDQPLFWCEMGQADGVYTLRVEDFVDHEQEFMDDILSH